MVYLIALFGNGLILPIIAPLIFENHSALLSSGSTLDFKDIVYSLCLFLPALSTVFSTPFISTLSDYINRKYCLYFCLSFGILSYLLTLLSIELESVALLLLGRFVGGISVASVSLAQAEIISEFPKQKVEKLSLSMIFGMIGFFLGTIIAGLSNGTLAIFLNLRFAFIIAIALTIFTLVSIIFAKKQPMTLFRTFSFKTAFRKIWLDIILTLQEHYVIYSCLLFFVISTVWNIQLLFSPFYLTVALSYTQAQLSIFFIYVGINMVLCYLFLNHVLVKQLTKTVILKWSFLATLLCALLLASSNNITLQFLAVSLFCFGFICGQSIFVSLITSFFSPKKQGRISGVINTIIPLSIGASALVISILSHFSLTLPFIFCVVVGLICLLLLNSPLFLFFKKGAL
jgi:MFS family permease